MNDADTLYIAGNSICTQKVLITLAEKDVPYETVNIDLFKNEQYDPAYLKINQKAWCQADRRRQGYLESTLISEYLDDNIPNLRLARLIPSSAQGCGYGARRSTKAYSMRRAKSAFPRCFESGCAG